MKKIVFVFVFTISFQISAQWLNLNSPDSYVYDLYILNNGTILCACNSGLYYSVDNFQNWDNLIDLPVYRIKQDNYGNIYVTSRNLYKSTDQGLSWHVVPYNTALDSLPHSIKDIFINDLGYIFIVPVYWYDGIPEPLGFKSTDFGETWDIIWEGTIHGVPVFFDAVIFENITGTLFVSYYYYGPYYGERNTIKKVFGGDWVTLFAGSATHNMYLFNQALYFATEEWYPVIKSKDDGNTFTQLNNGLPYTSHGRQLILKPEIFIALINDNNSNRIFYSFNEGENWSPFNLSGLNTAVISVYLDDNQTLYACTNSGIYVYTGPLSVEDKISQTDFSLSQNFPNPFNPSTNIQYAISSRQFVTLKVFDVLGKEVATLVNEEKPAGSYEVEFNLPAGRQGTASGIKNPASGIYFYQLKAGDFIETKKMVLLK